jgi:hypothetical protein
MLHHKHPHTQPSAPPGDRSPLGDLYAEEARLHLQLCTGRPSPDLLRRIARVEALLNRGAGR